MANITFEERKYLFDNGLHILRIWISPEEGYEYHLRKLGTLSPHLNNFFSGEHALCYRKSERACLNYAIRLLTKRAPDASSVLRQEVVIEKNGTRSYRGVRKTKRG